MTGVRLSPGGRPVCTPRNALVGHGVAGFFLGRLWGRDTSGMALGGLVLAAWIGELVVVTTLAPFLAGELSVIQGP